ncbi:RNA-binding S4 domain-containing protein [Candidatus Poribacteria bacterium]|nr:RNA-binding S4 domain-containing protein [Candidatus Poribacteria bacterium]
MRLDKFLQISRLVKRRTIANTLCSRGAVSVNGHVAKAGKTLAVGDVIRLPHPEPSTRASIDVGNELMVIGDEEAPDPEYEVLELPSGNVSRARAATLYRQL